MLPRRSLAFPLSLGIILICLLVMVLVGWILVTAFAAVRESESSVFWVLLPLGTIVLCAILAGVGFYLAYSVNSIRTNRQYANFVDAVTHELKSPIASLKLGLETMSRHRLSSDDTEKFTRAMQKDVHRLDRLISHLLQAAGLKVQPTEPDSELIDLKEFLRDCVVDVCTYHDFSEENISIETNDVRLYGSSLDFEIIFRNLIDNAVKYSGTPPRIEIVVTKLTRGTSDILLVAIENNGKSVPDSEKELVFNRFERTGVELERTKPGVGLGLYIVRMLLKRHRGTIRLETPQSNEGTRVVVEVPLASPTPSESQDIEATADENSQVQGEVLVV